MKKLIFFFFLQFAFSQEDYDSKWFSADTEHLPQNSVKSITPDKYGFIWMTTENGLVRFDGINFKVFNSNNFNFKANRMYFIKGNIKKDSLFTETENGTDIILINKRKPSISKSKYSNKYNYLNYHQNDFIAEENLENKLIVNNNDFYLIKKDTITFISDKKTEKRSLFYNFKNNESAYLLNDALFIIDQNGNYSCFNFKKLSFQKIKLPTNSTLHYNSLTQQLFAINNTEIVQIINHNNKLLTISILKFKAQLDYKITAIYYDSKNQFLYIGTPNRGLKIITLHKFKSISNPDYIEKNYYANIKLDQKHFLTSNGEIFSANNFIKNIQALKAKNDKYIISIDKNNNIWIKNGRSLYVYFKNKNYTNCKEFYFDNEIGSVFCDSNNRIWIGFKETYSKNPKILVIDGNTLTNISSRFNLPITSVVFFTEDKNKNILMASKKGLAIYNSKTNKFQFYLKDNDFRSIFICSDNKIWLCSYSNGISLFEAGKFTILPVDKRKHLRTAHCIIEDKNKHFWISSNKGLFEVSKNNLIEHTKNPSVPVYYHHYTMENGFKTNEFNGGCQPCATKLNDKRFIFPSINGIISFNPNKSKAIIPHINFFIEEAKLEDKSIFFKDTIYLERENTLTEIFIDIPFFGNNNNLILEQRISKTGKENWLPISEKRNIILTALSPGIHTLEIRKLNGFDTKFSTKKITLIVDYYFYETVWFKTLILVLLLSSIYLFIWIRYRILRLQNETLEKTINIRTKELKENIKNLKAAELNLKNKINQQKKLIGTISHDIKSPLKFLNIGINNLEKKSKDLENTEIQKISTTLNNSSKALLNFIDNLIEYSKIVLDNSINKDNFIDSDKISNDIINLYKNIASSKNTTISYKNLSSKKILINEKTSKIIISNLLDNAIKNIENGSIEVNIDLKSNKIFLKIIDTGKGFSDEQIDYYTSLFNNYENSKFNFQNNGLGLYLVIELVNLLNGDFKIIKNKPKGTIIEIVVDSKIINY